MTSYFVTIVTDYHLICLKIWTRDKQTATENVTCWCFVAQKRNANPNPNPNLRGQVPTTTISPCTAEGWKFLKIGNGLIKTVQGERNYCFVDVMNSIRQVKGKYSCRLNMKEKNVPSLACAMQIINNYWTRLSKISWFVCGEQINYLPKPKINNWSARHRQTTIFCDNRIQ